MSESANLSSNDEPTHPWYDNALIGPVILLILLLLAPFALIATPLVVMAQRRRERRFARRAGERGRFLAWQDLEPRLRAGDGTLVIEQAQKDGHRVWWTEDDLVGGAPTQPPAEEDLDYFRFGEPDPFVSWCFSRYLSLESGTASLTNPPYSYPPGFIEAAFFEDRFPKLSVVITVKLS